MLKFLADSLLALVYPQHCQICEASVEEAALGIACSGCWARTRVFDGTESLCEKCGAVFEGSRDNRAAGACRDCSLLHFDRAFSAGVYEGALAASILRLKTEPVIAGRFRRIIVESAKKSICATADTLVPVPLSSVRIRERGFNQAAAIANLLSKVLKIQCDENSLARTTHTAAHRAGMDRRAREATVEKAFTVARPKLIAGKHIVLIDDVLTSGSTASACAEVLKQNGAAAVDVFTAARTVRYSG